MCEIYRTNTFNLPYVSLHGDILMTKFAYVKFIVVRKINCKRKQNYTTYDFKTYLHLFSKQHTFSALKILSTHNRVPNYKIYRNENRKLFAS